MVRTLEEYLEKYRPLVNTEDPEKIRQAAELWHEIEMVAEAAAHEIFCQSGHGEELEQQLESSVFGLSDPCFWGRAKEWDPAAGSSLSRTWQAAHDLSYRDPDMEETGSHSGQEISRFWYVEEMERILEELAAATPYSPVKIRLRLNPLWVLEAKLEYFDLTWDEDRPEREEELLDTEAKSAEAALRWALRLEEKLTESWSSGTGRKTEVLEAAEEKDPELAALLRRSWLREEDCASRRESGETLEGEERCRPILEDLRLLHSHLAGRYSGVVI
ncbi:MAG: hypothetical protein IIV90_02100 [Oscillospiraceae bacterium]|nr:hypothetical protein [Oscillospiraceae bacterium]